MLTFLKRRWILVSCALVLVACSTFDLVGHNNGRELDFWLYGIKKGYLVWCYNDIPITETPVSQGGGIWVSYELLTWSGIRKPMLGKLPYFFWEPDVKSIQIPIWLPLATVIGWIVWRELRWREKRGKEAEVA